MMYKTRRKLQEGVGGGVQLNSGDKGWKITQSQVKWDPACLCVHMAVHEVWLCYLCLCLFVSGCSAAPLGSLMHGGLRRLELKNL